MTPLTEQGIQFMENSHRQRCLLIEGLPQYPHTPAPLVTVGWLPMGALWPCWKFYFSSEFGVSLTRVFTKEWHCTVPMNEWVTWILAKCRGAAHMYKRHVQTVCNCGFRRRLRTCVINNEFDCFNAHKSIIERIAWGSEIMLWRATCYAI